MTEWTDIDEAKPEDDQYCKVLFDDGSESYGTYWADMGIFALTGNATAEAAAVTHWQPGERHSHAEGGSEVIKDGDCVSLREPCPNCGFTVGIVKRKGFNDVVRCVVCDTFAFNMPKTESGKKKQCCSVTHSGITPSRRAKVLERADYCCQTCGIPANKSGGLQVGHIVSVKDGIESGMSNKEINSFSNLIAQCPECNLGQGKQSISFNQKENDPNDPSHVFKPGHGTGG